MIEITEALSCLSGTTVNKVVTVTDSQSVLHKVQNGYVWHEDQAYTVSTFIVLRGYTAVGQNHERAVQWLGQLQQP